MENVNSRFYSLLLPGDMHKDIKEVSHEANISMACICRQALTEFLQKAKAKGKAKNK